MKKGFTLVEVILALTLSSVIIIICLNLLQDIQPKHTIREKRLEYVKIKHEGADNGLK